MPNRRDVGLGWGDRDWNDPDFKGRQRMYRRPYYAQRPEYDRGRTFGRGPDLPYESFYGRDYGRSPESARYDSEDFGGYDRNLDRNEGISDYSGYRRYGRYAGYGSVYGAPGGRERPIGQHYGRGPRGYRRSDERIREEANDRLMFEPDLDATDVEVRVQDGIVTLAGVVEERRDKRLAEDIVEDVPGVNDVNNELKVRHGLWARITGEHVDEQEVQRETQREGTTRGAAETTTKTSGSRSTRSTAR